MSEPTDLQAYRLSNSLEILGNIAGVPKSGEAEYAVLFVNFIDEDGDDRLACMTSAPDGFTFPLTHYLGLAQAGQIHLYLQANGLAEQ